MQVRDGHPSPGDHQAGALNPVSGSGRDGILSTDCGRLYMGEIVEDHLFYFIQLFQLNCIAMLLSGSQSHRTDRLTYVAFTLTTCLNEFRLTTHFHG